MNWRSAKGLTVLVVSVAAGFFFVPALTLFGAQSVEKKAASKVLFPTKVGVSRPLREHLTRPAPATGPIKARPDFPPHTVKAPPEVPRPQDSAVQRAVPQPNMPSPTENFEGQFQTCGCLPPDTNAAVGPNEVVQTVNLTTEIWDKTGTDLSGGPFNTSSFWAGFGGPCQTTNDGDPVVLYDPLADRWVITQFAVEQIPFLECFAVSVTSDPLGSYYQSSYDFGSIFNDYPKMAVWPDAYHLTVRQFNSSGTAFFGMAAVAFDRAAMLAGLPATAIFEDVGAILPNLDGLLASNLQGSTLPPSASPTGVVGTAANTLVGIGHPDLDGSLNSRLHLFYFHPDFATPANSTFTGPVDISVVAFDPNLSGIPQPNAAPALEVLPWVLYPLNYRNFGVHESIVLTHNVNAGGGQSGMRWYELRDPRGLAGTPTVYQQGTYAPADGENRWMGAVAMDVNNNIAVGYSLSSTNTDPSIRYAGRLAGDPPGDLSQGEAELIAGTGEQTFGVARWGDYSSLYTDPVDQCTFWYTTEYIQVTGLANWQTRIGSFKFPSCTTGPRGTLEGTVTDASNSSPIAGATVSATGTAGASLAFTDAAGHYAILLPVDTYDMTVTAYGYLSGSQLGVLVTDGGDTIQDFTLAVAPMTTVSGTVTDGSGQGWPLYAKLVITGSGAPTFTLYTDPITGAYSKSLVNGISYGFSVSAAGYNTATATVPLGPIGSGATFTQDFILTIDTTCTAPGYSAALNESFDAGVLPAGWSVVNNNSAGGGGVWHIATGPGPGCSEFSGNLTGGTGPAAIVNSDCDGFVDDNTELRTPSVDMSSLSSASVQFNLDYRAYYNSTADVDISTNGGATWTNVFQRTVADERGPARENIDITGIAAGQPDVRARFHYTGYFAWWWQVDNVLLGTCGLQTGGLVVGSVHAGNTTFGFNGATITNTTSGGAATSFATPNDPNRDDGFYVLFAPAGAQTLQASLSSLAADVKTPTVVAGSVIQQDFSLRFLDVPIGGFAENFIYGLVGAGITAGCGGGNYCPNASVTRAQMAVFIEKAVHGSGLVPPACAGIFTDVPCPGGFAVDFIEALFNEGITAGCGGGNYCPNGSVTRGQMAVFIERGVHGSGFVPPACTGIFGDVPCPGGFAVGFIEALFNEGITAGCGGGNYCPNTSVTRAQMAVFIDKGFNIPHP